MRDVVSTFLVRFGSNSVYASAPHAVEHCQFSENRLREGRTFHTRVHEITFTRVREAVLF